MNKIIQIKWKFRVVCQNWGEKLMSNLFHIWFLVCRHFYCLHHWIFTAKIFEQSRFLLILLWNYINLILSTKTNVINYLNSLLTPSTNTLSTSERVFECNSWWKKLVLTIQVAVCFWHLMYSAHRRLAPSGFS